MLPGIAKHQQNCQWPKAEDKNQMKHNKPLCPWNEVSIEYHLVIWEDRQPGVTCRGFLCCHRFNLWTANLWPLHWKHESTNWQKTKTAQSAFSSWLTHQRQTGVGGQRSGGYPWNLLLHWVQESGPPPLGRWSTALLVHFHWTLGCIFPDERKKFFC